MLRVVGLVYLGIGIVTVAGLIMVGVLRLVVLGLETIGAGPTVAAGAPVLLLLLRVRAIRSVFRR